MSVRVFTAIYHTLIRGKCSNVNPDEVAGWGDGTIVRARVRADPFLNGTKIAIQRPTEVGRKTLLSPLSLLCRDN